MFFMGLGGKEDNLTRTQDSAIIAPFNHKSTGLNMALSEKECVPCKGVGQALGHEEAKAKLAEVPGWELSQDGRSIHRSLKFRNFALALDCVNQVGRLAEEQKHHPDIAFGWGYVRLTLQTHSIGGLHDNDFILAAKINKLL
jgi:4a-hydroxytetrahydrobiopterin dehydratase